MATRDSDSWGERSIPDGVTHSSDSAESVLRPFLGAAFLVAARVLMTKPRVLGDSHPSSHQTPALASDISIARGKVPRKPTFMLLAQSNVIPGICKFTPAV